MKIKNKRVCRKSHKEKEEIRNKFLLLIIWSEERIDLNIINNKMISIFKNSLFIILYICLELLIH